MTVQKNLVKNIYVGNGSTTQFPITFDVNTEHPEYIHVYLTNDDNITTETENFTVNLTAKTVTYPKEGQPLAPGKKLVIMRELPLQQLLDLINQGDFFADDIEQAFDDLTMITQQLSEKLARAMVFSVEVADFDNIIPLAPGMSFRINDEGTGLELTEDPAKVLTQAQNLLQQTTQQANIATNKANAAAESALAAATSETNAGTHEDKAQAWAESETSPDGEPDSKSAKTWAGDSADSAELAQKWAESDESPDGETDSESPTSETMSAKEWVLYAKQLALQIGNPVVEVTESNGTVTVEKSDGTTDTFKAGINMLGRNKTYAYGDIAYSSNLPSWAYLYCVQAGTTAASEPSFSSVNTMGQYITDGTVKWIVDDVRFGLPVGVPFHDKKLRPGCVKINGATVQRSDYIRIFHDADEDDAFYDKDDTYTFTGTTTVSGTTITGISAEDIEKLQTAKEVCGDGILITGTGIPEDCMIDEISTDSVTITVAATAAGSNVKISYGNIHNYPYLYGWGDGETTFVLPNYRGRVIQGGDYVTIIAPGLPNIIGSFQTYHCVLEGGTGAFTIIQGSRSVWGNTDSGNATTVNFSASKSNSIYGTSNTVQQAAISGITQVKF